jgi:hypothetical protein
MIQTEMLTDTGWLILVLCVIAKKVGKHCGTQHQGLLDLLSYSVY